MPSLTSDVASRVRQLRDQRGLSARELAERCIAGGQLSLTRSAIAKIESGLRFVTLDELSALAHALQVEPHDLMPPADPGASGQIREDSGEPASAGSRMTTELTAVPAIAGELRSLRRGQGAQAADLPSRIGRYLRELAGQDIAPEASDPGAVRQALAGEIRDCAARLTDDLRTAVMASLALLPETEQMAHLRDRASWLAERMSYTDRTALRRIDMAEQLLAEEIAHELGDRRNRTTSTVNGWYLDEFRAVLRLDAQAPESHERRRIVATQAGLAQVMAWLDVPRKDEDQPRMNLEAEILLGGNLVRKEDAEGHRSAFFIELPRPLEAGEAHEYELILRVPAGDQIRPHYIFTPEYQCNAFDLTVRFDPANLPAWIRVVSGETVRIFEHRRQGELITPNRAGEAHVRFVKPAMYLGYGLQWEHRGSGTRWETHG